MRKMKKFLCAALTTTMVLAMAAPSFAANITMTPAGAVTGTTDNPITHKYHVYKIFDLASHDGSNYAYYLSDYNNNKWKDFILDYEVDGKKAFKLNTNGYVLETSIEANSPEAAAFAKAAAKHAVGKDIPGVEQISENGETVTWTGLEEGYYVVDSTVGSLCLLGTNDAVVDLTDKNVAPSLTKYVDGADESVQVGETATYRIVVSAGDGAENYTLTDTMSEALDYVEGSIKVYKVTGMTEENAKAEVFRDEDARKINGGYSVASATENHGFVITFDNTTTTGWTSNDKIVVIYDATVNKNAATGTSITNTAKLTYGDGGETPDIPDVPSYTYQFDLQKTTMDANGQPTETQLNDAEFKLYNSQDVDAKPIQLVDITPDGSTAKVYRVAVKDENGEIEAGATESIKAGYATVKGLDKDTTYYLEETVAPTGYNLLTERTTVSNITRTVTTNLNVGVAAEQRIANSTGTILPSTGGIGTTIFYAAGIILMAGAVFFVVRRKKA